MAQAENGTIQRTVEDPVVVLALTDEETRVLRHVLAYVGGRQDGPRALVDAIADSLEGLGFQYDGAAFDVERGGINFI